MHGSGHKFPLQWKPFFFQGLLAKLINKFRWKAMMLTDSRVRTTNEILSSIKLIKMYAWEDSFRKKIAGIVQSPVSAK